MRLRAAYLRPPITGELLKGDAEGESKQGRGRRRRRRRRWYDIEMGKARVVGRGG